MDRFEKFEDMELEELQRQLEEKREADRIFLEMFDRQIEAEEDPHLKVMLLLMRECKQLSDRLSEIAEEYTVIKGDYPTAGETKAAREILEYLQAVEGGMDTFFKEFENAKED